jgi:acetyl-CoA synthetase
VGEPINEEAWNWYNREVGGNRCPIVDTWWQTETGGIMISSISGITPSIATFATTPLPGIQPCLMDPGGNEIREIEAEGSLCIKFPWPGMARTIYGDHERFKNTYYSTFPGHYFSGDGAKRDAQGNYRITGRMDDVLIVSGHNLGTAEIEDALNQHEMVAESAVVGFDHPIKGHAVYAFVSCSEEAAEPDRLRAELLKLVSDIIGPVAKPDKIQLVDGLPKTRSGKIMRRILRKIANGEVGNYGDISTLLNPEVVSSIAANAI